MGLYLKQIENGPMQNFQYLVGNKDVRQCFIVDPAWDVDVVLDAARQDDMEVVGALVTHAHFDHCNALAALLARKNMPVYVNEKDVQISKIERETKIFGDFPKNNIQFVKHGQEMNVGGTRLTFLHTPGHTPGSQCFLVDGRLIAGDTLFLGTCGRCDLPGSNPYDMFNSLNTVIARLPDDTIVCPGHNYSRSGTELPLGDVKNRNSALLAHTLDDFLALVGAG